MPTNETIVMSVGGSLIVPDQIDTNFLKNLKLKNKLKNLEFERLKN